MIAALLLAAQASVAGFAPPLDRPLRAVTEATRTDAGVTRRFTNARRIVFRRSDTGFRAEVTIESGEPATAGDDDPAAMFRAGFARIAGRTVVLRLDPAGHVTAIDDQAAVWKAFLDGIGALAPAGTGDLDRKRAGRIRAILAALAPMPPERQRAMLASLVEPLIAADIAAGGEAPPRAVRVPAGSSFGAAQLDGIRAVRRNEGRLLASVSAAGEVSVQGSEGQIAGRVTIETERHVDPASGLVLETRDTVRIEMPGAPPASRLTVTRFRAP
ncbi:hypothetical protein [Sphingomonas koreensis]